MTDPTLDVERQLLEQFELVVGIDEVGRGALAGPVAVGVCAIGQAQLVAGAPQGVRDSKLLSAKRRLAAEPVVRDWALGTAVGWASATEIDEFGITAALAMAALRGLGGLWDAGIDVGRAGLLLDGTHDWLSPAMQHPLPVLVRPKADRDCASVASASVVAKVARDRHMTELLDAHPEWDAYGWASNVGYGSAQHRTAIQELGPCPEHRRTWLSKII